MKGKAVGGTLLTWESSPAPLSSDSRGNICLGERQLRAAEQGRSEGKGFAGWQEVGWNGNLA